MRTTRRGTAGCAGLLLCALEMTAPGGCKGAGSNANDAGDDGAQFASCLESHQAKGVMPYAPGVAVPSSGGTFTATLVENRPGYPADNDPPGPEVKGTNNWRLQIADGTGAPVDGLGMTASPFMPDHVHGTSIVPMVTPQGGGAYLVSPLYLYMSGYWEITLDLQPAAAGDASVPDETAVFKVCIP